MGMQRTFGDVGFVFGPVVAGALDDMSGTGHVASITLCVAMLIGGALIFLAGSRGMRGDER
jgi:biotin transporter BioY